MENNAIAKLMLGFVVLIVGISLIGSIADQTNNAVDLTSVANETFDITAARLADGCGTGSMNATYPFTVVNPPTSGWQSQGGCPLTSVVIRNQTRDVLTSGTDYLFFATNGTFYLLNTTGLLGADCQDTAQTNVTEVDYIYCQDDYLDISWGRNVLTLVSGFFALALLGAAVGLFYSVSKDFGFIN